jgi:hypothetical protein
MALLVSRLQCAGSGGRGDVGAGVRRRRRRRGHHGARRVVGGGAAAGAAADDARRAGGAGCCPRAVPRRSRLGLPCCCCCCCCCCCWCYRGGDRSATRRAVRMAGDELAPQRGRRGAADTVAVPLCRRGAGGAAAAARPAPRSLRPCLAGACVWLCVAGQTGWIIRIAWERRGEAWTAHGHVDDQDSVTPVRIEGSLRAAGAYNCVHLCATPHPL